MILPQSDPTRGTSPYLTKRNIIDFIGLPLQFFQLKYYTKVYQALYLQWLISPL